MTIHTETLFSLNLKSIFYRLRIVYFVYLFFWELGPVCSFFKSSFWKTRLQQNAQTEIDIILWLQHSSSVSWFTWCADHHWRMTSRFALRRKRGLTEAPPTGDQRKVSSIYGRWAVTGLVVLNRQNKICILEYFSCFRYFFFNLFFFQKYVSPIYILIFYLKSFLNTHFIFCIIKNE